MKVIDGHSHMYQTYSSSSKLKKSVEEIEGFDINVLLKRLDEIEVSQFQTMPQEMTRIRGQWLGSNELSADIQQSAPARIISFAAAEPLDAQDVFNRARLKEVEKSIAEKGLKGLLLTPPYGHYYSNDKRVYPFYEKAVELDIPIYFHHSHNFGSPKNCPLKYVRIWLLDDLTIDFPELRFNVEHMGYPWTEELLAIMARSPNVYTDIAMFIDPYVRFGVGRPLLLARNLGMAREYGVLDRVFYGSDYVGEDIAEYISLLQREITYMREGLNSDMEKLGYPPLTQQELEGLFSKNVLKIWKIVV
ncbi:MAG: amidohydrolase family protein [Dehalococcoidia bacterium]